jgi:hypothetical protein
MTTYLKGSICLSDIPAELIHSVTCKDGQVRKYLDVTVSARREPRSFQYSWGTKTLTHYMSCAPKKEERKEGVNYYIADFETKVWDENGGGQQASAPQTNQGGQAVAGNPFGGNPAPVDDGLPF